MFLKKFTISILDMINYKRTLNLLYYLERFFSSALIIFLIILGSGCKSTNSSGQVTFEDSQGNNVTSALQEHSILQEEYRIYVNDEITIDFPYYPGLNKKIVVPPDGKIILEKIGQIKVAGLTTKELTDKLQNFYSQTLTQPEVVVNLTKFHSQILVLGEVNSPGIYQLSSHFTSFEAISLAGGYRESAYLKEVLVIRRIEGNKSRATVINMNNVLSRQNISNRFYLQPYDIVYVPQNPIVKLGTVLKQIYDLVPPFVSLGFSYSLNPEVEVR